MFGLTWRGGGLCPGAQGCPGGEYRAEFQSNDSSARPQTVDEKVDGRRNQGKRNHRRGIIEEESWRRNHGGGIIEESWRNHEAGLLEEG